MGKLVRGQPASAQRREPEKGPRTGTTSDAGQLGHPGPHGSGGLTLSRRCLDQAVIIS